MAFPSWKYVQSRFSRWVPSRPAWTSNQNEFSYFDLQVTLILPTKFRVKWPFGSGEKAQNRFLRWPPWRPPWISDRNDFSYFWRASHSDTSYQVSSQLTFWSGEETQNILSRYLGYPIGTILAIFGLQVALILPTKFSVIWPFGSGDAGQNRFFIGGHLGFPIGMIL